MYFILYNHVPESNYHENQLEINKNDSTICWEIT